MKAPKRRTIGRRWTAQQMYPNREYNRTDHIERDVVAAFPTQPYATHGSVCADLLLHELLLTPAAQLSPKAWKQRVIARVEQQHRSMVGNVLVYSANDPYTRRRVPKQGVELERAFTRNLNACYPLAVLALERLSSAGSSGSSGSSGEAGGEAGGALIEPIEPEPMSEPEPIVEQPEERAGSIIIGSSDVLRAHWQWCVGVRKLFTERGLHFSMRPTIDGIALLAAGCPVGGVRDACLMDYPEDLRSQCGVSAFDFAGFGITEYLTKAIRARVIDKDGSKRPVCLALIGPAGIGKTTCVKALAGGALPSIDMSAGTPLSAFYGIKYIDGSFTTPEFERWARGGGLHLFGEVDSSDPNLLKVLNKALANREYTNPISGETIKVHEDAVAIADSNTLGTGVQAEYSAAEPLDFSTIDRFRAGRLRCTIDEVLERTIVDTQIAAARS